MNDIYLDNAATTRCYEEVGDLVVKIMCQDFGNPSSMHRKGVKAEQYMKCATETLAKILRVQEKEIFFTSGGTESNNWAICGTANANRRRGMHVITTKIEHAAVSSPMTRLETEGFKVTRLGVDRYGCVNLKELEEAITPETTLVSCMYVNNEVGSVQPIREMGELIKEKNPSIWFHVDAIQAFGKYQIHPKKMKIDMLSVSGHKIHGPKGSGFLYVNEKTKLLPLILGGGQQNNMRSGTDNVPGVAGLGVAAKMVYRNLRANVDSMRERRHQLAEGLKAMENVVIHGTEGDDGAPHILNASFQGIRSEVLLHALEDKGIYISAGSACSSHKRVNSATLTAMGCSREEIESAVRFSFDENTSKEDIETTLKVLGEVVPMLRRFVRK